MKDAVIVATARTPIGKAMRGAFNDLKTPSMTAVAIRAAVERAGIEPAQVDDLVLGTAMQSGTAAINPVGCRRWPPACPNRSAVRPSTASALQALWPLPRRRSRSWLMACR